MLVGKALLFASNVFEVDFKLIIQVQINIYLIN